MAAAVSRLRPAVLAAEEAGEVAAAPAAGTATSLARASRAGRRRTTKLTSMAARLVAACAVAVASVHAFVPVGRPGGSSLVQRVPRRAHPALLAAESDSQVISALARNDDVLGLLVGLLRLEPTALALAQLTDAIEQTAPSFGGGGGEEPTLVTRGCDAARRAQRKLLLARMLRSDRPAYLETASFLRIPRDELPNLQDLPLRAWDLPSPPTPASGAASELVGGQGELVPDCTLPAVPMGENALESALLRVTRQIYAAEAGIPLRLQTPGILGLIAEMRSFMLSPAGAPPEAQQRALLRTLRRLMTPVLPPFYRLFMGWLVPSVGRGDPKWLQDAVQAVATRLPDSLSKELSPGRSLGPAPYAPLLTSVVAPFAFGFLVQCTRPGQLRPRSLPTISCSQPHRASCSQPCGCSSFTGSLTILVVFTPHRWVLLL